LGKFLTPENKASIDRLKAEGKEVKIIAKELNIPYQSVRSYLNPKPKKASTKKVEE
jgi:DNA invertase Pin-like site-specific DNA recombinase